MSDALAGLGVELRLLDLDGDPEDLGDWRPVGELVSLKLPTLHRNTTEVTNMRESARIDLVSPTLRIGPLTGVLNVTNGDGGITATAVELLANIASAGGPPISQGGFGGGFSLGRPADGGPEFGGGPTFHHETAAVAAASRPRDWMVLLPPDALPRWTFRAGVSRFELAEVGVDSPLEVEFALTLSGGIEVVEEDET